MGCVDSKLEQEEEEVVSICKERKHYLKLAVERRYTLADAHYKYCQALYGVSAALKLFVARHSTPTSPYLVTFPPPSPPPPKNENVVSNPLFLQQTPSEPTQETICCEPCNKTTTTPSDFSEEERKEKVVKQEQQPQGYGYFYMEIPQMVHSPPTGFGWDFFNPFNSVRPEIISGYHRISEEDLKAVREQEGIPNLEEEEDEEEGDTMKEVNKVVATKGKENMEQRENGSEVVQQAVHTANVNQEDQEKGLTVVDNPLQGRELLEALTDIEDHFVKAYDAGKEVSRMLEANWVHSQPNLAESKENSTKIIPAITWKSPASRSPSCKGLVASSFKSSSTWTEFKNDLFDDYVGMGSGSHLLTLGRLYAWEKKLYDEVKAGDSTWKLYAKKCNQLRNHGDEGRTADKTRAAVKELYSRILVTIRSAKTISKRIDELRDEELQPQIIELLQGMMRTWKIMLESHEIQNKIIFNVKSFTCTTYGEFCNDSHRLATLQLDVELQNWRARFQDYIAAQKAYVEALHGWMSKFTVPEVDLYSKSRSSVPACRANGPPLLMICHDWLCAMNNLPERAVSVALKGCGKDVRALWAQQGEEQQQKRKVDRMSKELDKKTLAFQKVENKLYEFTLADQSSELEDDHRAEYLKERKGLLGNFRKRVDLEKEEHQKCMQETQRITLNGFQAGFCRVFESITEFSSAALKMYSELLNNGEKAEKVSNPPSIESSQAGEDVKS
ncbi:unnamed protein product [Withania somnifera]